MMKWTALCGAAVFICAGPASAAVVTNTFIGTIAASDAYGTATTSDSGNYFGGGNLIGASFSLALTLDSSKYYTIDDPNNPSFITGGTFYSNNPSDNPISAVLTINGVSLSIDDSSDAYYGDGGFGPNEKYLQAFVYNPGYQLQTLGLVVDLTTNVASSLILTDPLPAMLLSNNDFVNNNASFYDGYGENLALTVLAVNTSLTSVPEPSSLAMLAAALVALARRPWRSRAAG